DGKIDMQFKFDEHPAAADFEKKCENEFSQNLVTGKNINDQFMLRFHIQ
ncbi:7722_t:CDS:1, partial [Entrophospora sp. SA101]